MRLPFRLRVNLQARRDWPGRLLPGGLLYGLRPRLVGLVVVTALATGVLLGGAVIQHDQAAWRDEIAAGRLGAADLVAGLTSLHMGGAQASVRELAGRPEVWRALDGNDVAALQQELARFVNIIPEIERVTVFDGSGRPVAADDANLTVLGAPTEREWMLQVLTLQQAFLGWPELGSGAGQPFIPYAVPIFDDRDALHGVVVANISLTTFAEALNLLEVGDDSQVVLLDLRGEGVVVAHPDRTRLLSVDTGLVESVVRLRSRGRSVWETTDAAGTSMLVAFAPVGGLPWGVLIGNPTRQVFGVLGESTQRALGLGCLAVLVAGVLGAALAVRLTRPLLRLRAAAQTLAQGQTPGPLLLTQRDEIGELGRAFDQMAHALSGRATALEQANSDFQVQTWQLTLLSKASTVLQTATTANEACEVTRDYLSLLLPSSSGAVCVPDGSSGVFEPLTLWGEAPPVGAAFRGDACSAVRFGQPYWTADTGLARACAHVPSGGARNQLCVPMLAQGEPHGVICVSLDGATAEQEALAPEGPYQQTTIALASLLAVVLRNLALQERLRQEATRDPLTGLFNRRYLDASLERELFRAMRSGSPLGMVLFDLDHFKRVNDTFGHDVGDILLREFGDLLRSRSRGEDLAARFGGEEFVLVLPGATLEVSLARAEQVREAIRGLPVQERIGLTTVSVGVAEFPEHGKTVETLFQAADGALYRAKESGRNQVAHAAPRSGGSDTIVVEVA